MENQRLKKELKSCKSTDAAAESCSHCSHSQVRAPASRIILVTINQRGFVVTWILNIKHE